MKIYISKIKDIPNNLMYNLTSFVDNKQQKRIKNFVFKNDAIRTLIGDLLVRSIFSEEYKVKREDIVITRNAYGKTFIHANSNFYYNLSHSGDYVVCAIDKYPIGVDIEQITDIEYELLSKQYFSESEYSFIKNDKDCDDLNNFLQFGR